MRLSKQFYTVHIAGSDVLLRCAEDETILAAATRQGVALSVGCKQGICGNCLFNLLKGKVKYPDGDPLALSDCDQQKKPCLELCWSAVQSFIGRNS